MKAVWAKAPFAFKIRNLPTPIPCPNEALVRIEACGICGTDIGLVKTGAEKWIPLGHEASGIVEKTGSEVTCVEAGDKVVIENHTAWGTCKACRNGNSDYCQNLKRFQDPCPEAKAAFAEYICLHESMLFPYTRLTAIAATLIEPLTVAIDMVLKADIPLNAEGVVIGPGTIGLMAVKIAKLRGARRVFLCGMSHSYAKGNHRLITGQEMGADIITTAEEENAAEIIKTHLPQGVDRVMVTAPPQAIPQAVEMAKFGGKISYIGINWSKNGGNVNIDLNKLHFQKQQLCPSHAIPNSRFPIALDLLQRKIIDPDRMITHTFKLEEIEKAMKTAVNPEEKVIKVVVIP